jgi:hypothetical protein
MDFFRICTNTDLDATRDTQSCLTATCDTLTVIAVTRNFEGPYNYSEDEMNVEENQRMWLWQNSHVALAKQHNLFKLPVLGL